MHRSAIQTLTRRAPLLYPRAAVLPCSCPAAAAAGPSSPSSSIAISARYASSSSKRFLAQRSETAPWRRWQSSTAAAAAAAAPPSSSPAPLPSQPARRRSRAVNTSLPQIKDQRLLYAGVAAFAITAWTFFVLWAMSAEKACSSVVRTLAFNLRSSPVVRDALGEGVKLKPFLWSDNAWVHGKLNTIQGIVDINFRVFAADGREGTVYFKSVRPARHGRFETVHFRLLVDGQKETIDLKNTDLLQLSN